MMDLQDYLNLIPSQHRDKSKYIAFLTLLLTPFINVSKINEEIKLLLNLDTATGTILDMIGKILVLPRLVNFQPSDGSSPILDDDHYRLILKAKVAKNQWKGTMDDLYNMWDNLFPNNPLLLVDRQNMTASVVVVGLNSTLERELITNGYIVPKPAGVRYDYGFTEEPIYSQDMNTEWLKGFDEGYWLSFTNSGELTYGGNI